MSIIGRKSALEMAVIDKRYHFAWEELPLIRVGCRADGGRFMQIVLNLVVK